MTPANRISDTRAELLNRATWHDGEARQCAAGWDVIGSAFHEGKAAAFRASAALASQDIEFMRLAPLPAPRRQPWTARRVGAAWHHFMNLFRVA